MRGISHQVLEASKYCAKLYLRGVESRHNYFYLIKSLSLPVWGGSNAKNIFSKGNSFPHCVENNILNASTAVKHFHFLRKFHKSYTYEKLKE
jgi:hypothetical protein